MSIAELNQAATLINEFREKSPTIENAHQALENELEGRRRIAAKESLRNDGT